MICPARASSTKPMALASEVLARPEVAERVAELKAAGVAARPAFPGPDREQVLALVA